MTAPRQPHDEAATSFVRRHIGPSPRDVTAMLEVVGAPSLTALMAETLPASIRQKKPLDLGKALSEPEALAHMRELAAQNQIFTSLIGMGYSGRKRDDCGRKRDSRPGSRSRPSRPR